MEDGVIKYEQHFIKGIAPTFDEIESLNNARDILFDKTLIGAYQNGIGYGNVSIRTEGMPKFIISASQTGHIPSLSTNEYTYVIDYIIDKNKLWCQGQQKASSESLTHAAFYELDSQINCVLHIHSKSLWDKYLDILPTSHSQIPYGTPQMAAEVLRLWNETSLKSTKILVMGGHEEGIISFGSSVDEALKLLLKINV